MCLMKPFWLPWNPLSQSRRGGVISFEENKTSCQEKIYKMKKGGKRGIQPTITGLFIIIKMKKKIQKQNVCARINQKFEAPVADLSFLFALTCLLNFFVGYPFPVTVCHFHPPVSLSFMFGLSVFADIAFFQYILPPQPAQFLSFPCSFVR